MDDNTAEEEEHSRDMSALAPRGYQEELGGKSLLGNTIIHLPTGSGKTYIAIMLIKKMKKDLLLPWKQGGKRSIFVVNNVPLVEQQKNVISQLAPVTAGGFSSENRVDFWKKDRWDIELAKYQVLVMTGQILVNMLQHDYIRLQDINLLIFDECHHAVIDHPMRQIMKMFEICPKDEQPKVLGLTATLLNSNVSLGGVVEAIKTLETTFHATIATVDDMGKVLDYSTNPRELIMNYRIEPPGAVARHVSEMLRDLIVSIHGVRLIQAVNEVPLERGQVDITKDLRNVNKKVANMVSDTISHIRLLGPYGGSLCLLAYIISLERIRRRCSSPDDNLFFKHAITHMQMARAVLEKAMDDEKGYEKIWKYSSEHIHQMLYVLKEFDERMFKSTESFKVNKYRKSLSALIFVRQRFTAKILYNLLKAVKETNPTEYEFLKPDFIVGFNINPFNNTREQLFEKKCSQSALLQFSNGEINCLIATSVIEEGIDIPQCSLVLRYDPPSEYRSYIQSKGRARCKTSNYVVLVNEADEDNFRRKYASFNDCERHIQNILVGVGKEREAPSDKEIEEDLYNDTEIPPFVLSSGARISETSAIALLNQYCSLLPHDQFSIITPNWIQEMFYDRDRMIKTKQITIFMPINCPIKEPIKGDKMENLKSAKRSAALKACIALYHAGELEPTTALPKRYASVNFEQPDVKNIFLNWEDEPTLNANLPAPGTKKRIRNHNKVYPKCFKGVGNWKFGTSTFYLHVITLKTAFEKPQDSRDLALYELLKMDKGYAILTSQALPKLCDFPMFVSVGEVRTTLEVNYGVVTLDHEMFEAVKEFHHFIFDQVLNIAKKFVVFEGTVNAAYIVPVMSEPTGIFEIDWHVIHTHENIAPVEIPTDEVRKTLRVTEDYKYSVITPWYRSEVGRYIVSNVMDNLTPSSPFDKENCGTYKEYYSSKYNLNVMGRQDESLLEVKQIGGRMNCLLPRAATLNTLAGKQLRLAAAAQGDDKQNTFKEILIPEFCIKYDFPGVLWYKATILPSILHRVSMLLVANDLRTEISHATKIGSPSLPQSQQWKPLNADVLIATNSLLACCHERTEVHTIDRINCPPEDCGVKRSVKIATMKDSLVRLQMKKLDKEFPWDEKKEPMDIERNLTSVTFMDIECYDEFMNAPATDEARSPSASSSAASAGHAICPPPLKCNDKIQLLSKKQTMRGLELSDLLTALTVIKSNDSFNLERTETLGDSFLKFAATLYLFHKFPKLNEGQLTNIKSRLIGNRNLFYAGRRVNLGGRMKVETFSPCSDFVLPAFSVPKPIADFISEVSIRPTFLIDVKLEREEQLCGAVREETLQRVRALYHDGAAQAEEESEHNVQVPMQCYLHRQAVPDKVVADGVESLLGVYLVGGGLLGGVRILEWLRVLPAQDNFESYLTRRVSTALTKQPELENKIEFLLDHNRRELETILDYNFKDPSLLLEALSHPTYNNNRLTHSYERLEFLGDAVLDFLITAHLFENQAGLKPGELTDLRSALVNNVTFAGYVVKLGLHKYMLAQINPNLERAVAAFVQHQDQRQHNISEDVLYLIDEEDCKMAQYIEVPKILSDIFESLAGAVFLDSGGDLQCVWRVYYRIMYREIDNFSKNVPIQPVRMLRERVHACPHFGAVTKVSPDLPVIMAPVTLTVNGRVLTVHGFGSNKHQAQRAAAKIALKNLGCDGI